MTGKGQSSQRVGDLLQRLVNRISHRGGDTLAIMNAASVTLQQVLLLSRISERGGKSTSSELAAMLAMSLSSVSQMIDRLAQQRLVDRVEIPADRRKRRIALTAAGSELLARIGRARSAEYEAGIMQLSPQLRAELELVLSRALDELAAEQEEDPDVAAK